MNFIRTVKSLFNTNQVNDTLSELEKKELNQAIVELMLEMVRADFIELYSEKTLLSQLIEEVLGVDVVEIKRYIERAELRTDFSLSLQTQTNVINNYMGRDEKSNLLVKLWDLANADNELHLLEENLIYKVGHLLGFNKSHIDKICNIAS
ncbi:MAG: TerB family tellurite resistance protein [Proteobacteria bacterium]|nr:TerB family tellurite resistance protein [Pseudomonadota bacterium]